MKLKFLEDCPSIGLVVRRSAETSSTTYARRATVDRGSDRGSIPRASMAKPSGFLGVLLVSGPWVSLGCPLGIPYSVRRVHRVHGWRYRGGAKVWLFLCIVWTLCVSVGGQMGSGIPRRSAESSPAWIMSLCSEGLCGVARSLIPGWRMRCTPGYVSGVSSLAGWGHDHLDGEGAVGTDYTGCRQRVIRQRAETEGAVTPAMPCGEAWRGYRPAYHAH